MKTKMIQFKLGCYKYNMLIVVSREPKRINAQKKKEELQKG
jgi:hypothetical protein